MKALNIWCYSCDEDLGQCMELCEQDNIKESLEEFIDKI